MSFRNVGGAIITEEINYKLDYLFIIGVILGPMTGLRIAKVGPAELLLFIWCLKNLPKLLKLSITNRHFLFWFIFLFCTFIGTAIGILFYPDQVILSHLLTWIYLMFISIGIYSEFNEKEIIEIENILTNIAEYGIIWNIFLYLYSVFVSSSFFGAPLWYGGGARFSGGGTNPHQISVFLSAIIFINYRSLLRENNTAKKIKYILLILSGGFLAKETASATLTMALFLTALAAFLLGIINIWKMKDNRLNITLLLILVSLIFLVTRYDNLIRDITLWIQSDPNGLGRLEIFSTIGDSLSKSLFFGLGPGVHAYGGLAEYHNTYLEILAMSGITGLVVYGIYSVSLFKTLKIDYTLILIILPLYIYGFAGFAMRRLVYWAILMVTVVLAEKLNNATKNKSLNMMQKNMKITIE